MTQIGPEIHDKLLPVVIQKYFDSRGIVVMVIGGLKLEKTYLSHISKVFIDAR